MGKRKWEVKYEKYYNGEMDSKIQELEEKVNNKTANKEEYDELKKMQKVKANVSKVKNILELKSKLQKESKEIKQELDRRKTLKNANIEASKIQKQFELIDEEREKVLNELKKYPIDDSKIKDGNVKNQKEKLKSKMQRLDEYLDKNNEMYVKNQQIFTDSKDAKNTRMASIDEEDLKKRSFEIGSKISKCNMVANNLMEGLSWDAIEIKLDNWQDRKFTSEEKITEKVSRETSRENDNAQKGENVENLEDAIVEMTEKLSNPEEQALAEQSKFEKKHPRLARIFKSVKEKWNAITGKTKKGRESNEGNEGNEVEEPEHRMLIPEETEENGRQEEAVSHTNTEQEDFKKYLKDVAEKGMEATKKEKLEKAKQEAYKREADKYGKDYAEKSYHMEDDEGRE